MTHSLLNSMLGAATQALRGEVRGTEEMERWRRASLLELLALAGCLVEMGKDLRSVEPSSRGCACQIGIEKRMWK